VAKLRAAVLAAGRGVRIGGDVPKSLLPVGEHEPLLHYTLAGLRAAGVDDVLVVTGFKPKAVQSFAEGRWGNEGITFVFNARYASWGNFHSVRLALDQSPGMDVLVVNSDVVVPPETFRKVAESAGDLVLAVQHGTRLDEEDMRVELRGTRVRGIGKHLRMGTSHGEYAGVSLLRRAAAHLYLQMATDLEWQSRTAGYYEDIYAAMLGVLDARAVMIGPEDYAEVDQPQDFERAAAVIARQRDLWPAPAHAEHAP